VRSKLSASEMYIREAEGYTAIGGAPLCFSKVLPDGKNQLRTEPAYYALCAVRPVFRPAYSSKRLGYRASPLRISDSGVSVGLLSLNSPLDCPEPNARPSGFALHTPSSVCLRQPLSPAAPSALGKAFGGALRCVGGERCGLCPDPAGRAAATRGRMMYGA